MHQGCLSVSVLLHAQLAQGLTLKLHAPQLCPGTTMVFVVALFAALIPVVIPVSLPLMRLLDKIFPRKENNESITELYPADITRTYEVRNPIKEAIDFICSKFNDLFGKLQFLQSGLMQNYLWISVIFLVLAILYAIFSSSAAGGIK
jgi:hypothetical protein